MKKNNKICTGFKFVQRRLTGYWENDRSVFIPLQKKKNDFPFEAVASGFNLGQCHHAVKTIWVL